MTPVNIGSVHNCRTKTHSHSSSHRSPSRCPDTNQITLRTGKYYANTFVSVVYQTDVDVLVSQLKLSTSSAIDSVWEEVGGRVFDRQAFGIPVIARHINVKT